METTLTTGEAAKILGIKSSTVRQLGQDGKIKKVLAGTWGDRNSRALYDRESVLNYRDTRQDTGRRAARRKTTIPRPRRATARTATLAVELAKLEGLLIGVKADQTVLRQLEAVKQAAGL